MILGSQKDVRTRIQQALQKFNIKQVDVARQTGIHHSTLSLWLQGKIKGNCIKIEDTLDQWLKNLYSNRPRYSNSISKDSKQIGNVKSIKKGITDQIDDYHLVPITIDLQMEGRRFRQVFSWNVHESYLSPQMFAKLMAQQNNLPGHYEHQISQTIKRCIQNYKTPIYNGQWIKVIQLDIRIDNISLKDKFQWDIANPKNSPEQFAIDLCEQMELSGEFAVKIAHQIRQQIQLFQKMGDRDRKPINNFKDQGWLRYDDQGWQPRLELLDPQEIKKLQKLEQRKNRYYKRFR